MTDVPKPPSGGPKAARRLRTETSKQDALRNAVIFLAVVAGGFVVMELQAILAPLVVATFLLILIDAFSLWVERRWPRCPEWLRLSMAAALIIVGFAVVMGVCAHYIRPFATEIIALEPKLDAALWHLTETLQLPPLTVPELARGENASSAVLGLFGAARGVVSRTALVMIYLGFLLASRRPFALKMQRLFEGPVRHAHALAVFQSVRTATEQYMTLQTFKAALMALTGVITTSAIGLPNAPFWAFLLFLAAYVPIVGGIAAALVPSLVALAQFDTPVKPLLLLVVLGGAIFLIDNVLMPKLQADRLNIDPVVVLLSLGFWGLIFGLPGVFLSTPLTVVVMALTAEFRSLRWIAILLSKEGEVLRKIPVPLASEGGTG
ncbi:MAG TPA: AI-2E family transporter [Caulobacteraceae bacterium]|jgi:predicted PurR-regulated permease PerM|nr:AI-2E family transporter [Caulobacteraceae bacterium]